MSKKQESKLSVIVQRMIDDYPDEDLLIADGFDRAIIGVDPTSMRVIYSVRKCIRLLEKQGMSEEEAVDYFDFNVSGSYVGEKPQFGVIIVLSDK